LLRTSEHVYFPGLNALRFYAAISVVIAHIATNFGDLRKQSSAYPLLDALVIDAQTAVSLFFVLSGFLITYLLLAERGKTGTIRIRQFYTRRILRIWPLYYGIAFICFVLLPPLLGSSYFLYSPPLRSVLLVIFLLPNWVGPLGPLGHLWTIGLEEQFYIVWPWVAKNPERLLKVIFGIVFLKLVLAPVVSAFNSDAMMNLFLGSRFECMAIGALGAYLYYENHRLLRLIYDWRVQAFTWMAFIFLMLVDVPVTAVVNFVVSIIFVVLILNISTNPNGWLKIENPVLNYLGTISYGIYMVHFPVLYVLLFMLREWGVEEGHVYNLIAYTVTIGLTLLIAAASYRWFESPFIKLKSRFAVVQSRVA